MKLRLFCFSFLILTERSISQDSADVAFRKLYHLNVCCGGEEIFNYGTRDCEKSDRANKTVLEGLFRIKGQVAVMRKRLDCKYGMVDYDVKVSNLIVTENSVKINPGDITVPDNTQKFCVDHSSTISEIVVIRMCQSKNVCASNVCITKCTPDEYNVMVNDMDSLETVQRNRSLHSLMIQSDAKKFKEFRNIVAKNPAYTLMVQEDNCKIKYFVKKEWHLTKIGYIRVNDHKKQYKSHRYCLDVVNSNTTDEDAVLFVCLELNNMALTAVSIFRGAILIVSCIFIFVTIIAHLIVPSFQNIYGRCSVWHCFCYLITFLCMAMVHFQVVEKTRICSLWGYLTLFFNIAIFSWLNVLCYLIWNGIGRNTVANVNFTYKRGSFMKFSTYAWGVPALILAITIACDAGIGIPEHYEPSINNNECWFPRIDSFGEFIYFTIPTTILTMINVGFFIMTIINFNKSKISIYKLIKKNSSMDLNQVYTEQFFTGLKLLFMMGTPLISDTIVSILWYFNSAILDGRTSMVFAVIKVINSLQGVILFIIFLGKRKIFLDFKSALLRK